MSKTLATWIISTLAGVVTLWATLDPWPKVGWVTPNQVAATIAPLDAVHDEISGEMKEFRDEWKCDEYHEELIMLLRAQKQGDTSVETQDQIDRIREKMRKLDCSRFEDFG